MSKKLAKFDFIRGNGPIMPWDEWLNGDIWQLTRGTDFTGRMENFRVYAYRKAKARGVRLRIRILDDGVIVLQAFNENGKK